MPCQKDIICSNADLILNSVADGLFTVDKDMIINYFNKAAEKITGISKEEAIGKHCYDILRADICEKDCLLKHSYNTGLQTTNRKVNIINKNGKVLPISISTAILRDKEGNTVGGVESFRDLSPIEELRKEIHKNYTFQDIISKNQNISKIFEVLPNIAESESTVLIQGESGTGKELFAHAIHNLSNRQRETFIAVNCSALPEHLLESELFGYKKGAFTDAKKDKPGRFAMAGNGTIFLDEIDSLSLSLQVKLLRVIEHKTYEPLGSTITHHADVRIIASTKNNLLDLVHNGKFRDDLYFRLNVIKIHLPTLIERREDIPLLIDHFISKFNNRMNKEIIGVDNKVMKLLMNHSFPGNVRELENIIEHAFVMCKNGYINEDHLPFDLLDTFKSRIGQKSLDGIDAYERNILAELLNKNNGNKILTAKELGISRSTLWRKLKKHHLT